ncbi:MAG: hypothetical protein QM809_17285 [Gordonia sp. (in: high G+C Gram-positive bacteria)]|uniref:hypothetical protein n=1 Tax=Gordonia sp. (in: high G+C Gram-positive bacteria) TaxID=84139 RepID=UPI0039E5B699
MEARRRGDDRLQGVERFIEDTGSLVVADLDPFEERLIEESADVWLGGEVAVVAVLGVLERELEVGFECVDGRNSGCDLALDCGKLPGDTFLLVLEEFERHSAGVVGSQ